MPPTEHETEIDQPYQDTHAAQPLAVRAQEVAMARAEDAAEVTVQRPVRQSRETDELEHALALAWLEFPPLKKGREAEIAKGSTRFTYSYASLPDVDEMTAPVLKKLQIARTFTPTRGHIVCRLYHVPSRQWKEGDLPVPPTDARLGVQAIGGALTYQMRRLICAMLGVVLQDDDDGALATAAAKMPPALRDDARALAREPGGRVELITRMKENRIAADVQRAALAIFEEASADIASAKRSA